ncbi:MAG: hypothetical protein Q4F35_04225 [Akkermansia sp.]|nr:hypothetical protein [Akkermansia sp.]
MQEKGVDAKFQENNVSDRRLNRSSLLWHPADSDREQHQSRAGAPMEKNKHRRAYLKSSNAAKADETPIEKALSELYIKAPCLGLRKLPDMVERHYGIKIGAKKLRAYAGR